MRTPRVTDGVEQGSWKDKLPRYWHVGVMPSTGLQNCLAWRPLSTWLAMLSESNMVAVVDVAITRIEPLEVCSGLCDCAFDNV
jgi:hypothetical protein